LASVVIVIEAGESSGALITARRALELHRQVGVVPGQIDSPASTGSNALMSAGATPILSPAHVLESLNIDPSPPILPFLDADAAKCWDALLRGASSLADIARVAGLSTRSVAAAISALELEGLVVVDVAGRISTTLNHTDL
jgi:DNA processing protein